MDILFFLYLCSLINSGTVVVLGTCFTISVLIIVLLIAVVLSFAKRKRSAERIFTALNDDGQPVDQRPLIS